jgi:hypothetical protein
MMRDPANKRMHQQFNSKSAEAVRDRSSYDGNEKLRD